MNKNKVPIGPATLTQRVAALLVDGVVVGGCVFALEWLVNRFIPTGVTLTVGGIYVALLEARTQTVGERLLRLRVLDHESGSPIGVRRAMRRYSSRFFFGLLLGIPLVVAAVRLARNPSDRPSWDRRSGTTAVRVGTSEQLSQAIVKRHLATRRLVGAE